MYEFVDVYWKSADCAEVSDRVRVKDNRLLRRKEAIWLIKKRQFGNIVGKVRRPLNG